MDKFDGQQWKTSNIKIDWASQDNIKEAELREIDKTVSKTDNDSHL